MEGDRMKWEYLVDNLEHIKFMHGQLHHPERMQNAFIALGKEGWELVCVNNGVAYFKREIRNVSKPKITRIADDNSAKVTFKQAYDD